jgi:hypothetical protein
MTDDNLKVLHDVYWELAIGEDNPGDFRRLASQRLATPYLDPLSASKGSVPVHEGTYPA